MPRIGLARSRVPHVELRAGRPTFQQVGGGTGEKIGRTRPYLFAEIPSANTASWQERPCRSMWPGDASRAFLDMECLPQDVFKSIKAPLMLEILSWDPNSTSRKETFSLASMPTSLTPKNEEEKNRGNYEPCFSFVCFFPSCSYDFPSKNFQDMSRFFFNLYYLESLFRNVLMVLIL